MSSRALLDGGRERVNVEAAGEGWLRWRWGAAAAAVPMSMSSGALFARVRERVSVEAAWEGRWLGWRWGAACAAAAAATAAIAMTKFT